jgi:hypothetical protein
MEKNIQKQLDIIEKSNAWIKTSLEGNKAKEAYRSMVNCRRHLNKKKHALEGNPAAAMYGESQAGKSYLVSALLSDAGKSFVVSDGNGNEYDFKNQINPRGNEMESTSLVTRFSTKYKYEQKKFPIIAKMLTPTDLILVICEAYYHNLNVNKTLSFDELKEKIDSFESKYGSKSDCQKLIIEDDVIDIEDYFNDNFTKLVYNNLKDAHFFEKLSAFVTKIPSEEWKDVFPLFWNFNPQLTKLFNDLIIQFKLLNFADTVYLPVDAVLREKGTILDVSRLDEIYDSFKGQETQYSANSTIFLRDITGNEKTIDFSKPYLCALVAELIFVLPDSIKTQKPFLTQTDLLDFPGTRRFESTNEDNITDKSLTVLLRRGKVDYLFNKYSNNERINALLFCQNHKQSNQSVMPEKLNRWIGNMIGKTPAERQTFISPISSLFVISTWFNKDLEFDFSNDKSDTILSLNERWNQRFTKTLEKEIIKAYEYPWLVEWTVSNPYFQNIFLLRDFEKSGTNTQNCSNIYEGYHEFKKEISEIIPTPYPAFREDLKKSFINYDFVKRHFANPAESWDEAASINKDGAKLIIDKLTIAANHINPARIEKMRVELNEISQTILTELLKHFHSEDKDKDLQKAKNIAGDIQFKLATAFIADKIKYFGQLMKELMLDESAVLELFRKEIYDIKHRDFIITDKYSTYRIEVPVEKDDTAERYFERLCIKYEKTSDERKEEFRTELTEKQIDLEELIKGNSDLIKNNSQQLAESLLKYWFEYISLNYKHTIQQILAQDASLDNIKDMYQKLFKKLGFADRIAEKIRRYVDGHNKTDLPFEIVADISTELLNKCINTVGFEYFDESEINDLKQANKQNKLGLVLDINTNPTENSVEELFDRIDKWTGIIQTHPEEMKSLPSYRNYLAWSNRLKVGFVAVYDIPKYDLTVNANLGKIIDECKTIKLE